LILTALYQTKNEDKIMLKSLLTTTAIVTVLSSGALAADTTKPATTDTMQTTGATPTANPNATIFDRSAQGLAAQDGYYSATKGQLLASSLIGENVYNSSAENAEKIGDVNDIVMGPNGTADAVIIGVGGFLGAGEKLVAIGFDRLNWVERDGDRWLMVDVAKEQLEAAPAFDTSMFQQVGMAAPVAVPHVTVNDTTTAPVPGAAAQDSTTTAATPNASGEFTTVDRSTLTAEALIGTRVYGANDADHGEIGDIVVGADGMIEAYIVDVGGFLGMGEKPVAVDAAKIDILRSANDRLILRTAFTEEQLKAQTAYNVDGYKTNRETMLMR
jgi:sporulation protein YlmC with PRC-barrel domain